MNAHLYPQNNTREAASSLGMIARRILPIGLKAYNFSIRDLGGYLRRENSFLRSTF
jgi:hypothetical protein